MKGINHSASRTDLRNAKRRLVRSTTAIVVAALALSSCGGSDDPPAPPPPPAKVSVPYTNGVTTAANPVAYWNKIASDTINLPGSATGTAAEQRPVLAVDLVPVGHWVGCRGHAIGIGHADAGGGGGAGGSSLPPQEDSASAATTMAVVLLTSLLFALRRWYGLPSGLSLSCPTPE